MRVRVRARARHVNRRPQLSTQTRKHTLTSVCKPALFIEATRRTSERSIDEHGDVVFGMNDFDEAVIYDFHLDVWRLAVSVYTHALDMPSAIQT